jgi:hypothetical protein
LKDFGFFLEDFLNPSFVLFSPYVASSLPFNGTIGLTYTRPIHEALWHDEEEAHTQQTNKRVFKV